MIKRNANELYVTGRITNHNAVDYYREGLAEILNNAQYPLVVNLSQLEHGSTLALAIFVQWLRQTPQTNGLVFKAVPEKMMKIIQACHLEHDLKLLK